MEKEISSGAMLGIVLIALAAIIGLGFGVFAIAKGTANEGVTNVQENLGAVSQSAYTDYDQKIITGTQVNSAYQNFEGKNAAILVMTQATKDKAYENTLTALEGGNGVDAAYNNAAFDFKTVLVESYLGEENGGNISYTPMTGVQDSKNRTVAHPVYVNYNAILGEDAGSGVSTTFGSGRWIYFDTNCWRTTAAFYTIGGKVQFNNVSGNMNKSGMMEYIPSSARFQSYLIKDVSGTIMGIACEQIGGK